MTQELTDALALALESFDEGTLERGFEYFDTQRVEELEIDAKWIGASVAGRSNYFTEWTFSRGKWVCECDCPVEFQCKHAAAVAMGVLARAAGDSPPTKPLRTAREMIEDQAVREWEKKFAMAELPVGRPAVRSSLRLRLRLDFPKILWEASAEGGHWRTLNSPEVRTIAEERSADSLFARDAATNTLIELARRTHGRFEWQRTNFALKLEREEDVALLAVVLEHPLTQSLVVAASGEPMVVHDAPLRWKIGPSGTRPETHLVARLTAADGGEAPEGMLLAGEPPLRLTSGEVYRLPPPIGEGLDYAPTEFPREALARHPRAAAALLAAGAALPTDLTPRVRRIALKPRFEFELVGDANYRNLMVRLLAASDDAEFSWCGRLGWQPVTEPMLKSDPDGTVRDYDPGAAEPLVDRLGGLGLGYFQHQDCWGRQFTKKVSALLANWAEDLPPGLDIRASAELASFFAPVTRISLEFHIEENPNSPDWFDLRIQLSAGDLELTPAELKELARSGGKLVQLKSGRWIRAEIAGDPALEETARRLGLGAPEALSGETVTCHALQLAAQPLDQLLDERAARRLRQRAEAITAVPPPPVPPDLRAELRPYQLEGFQFLAFLSSNGFGGILADDMGLGKTVQGLAWLLWLRSRKEVPEEFRVLVVCPKSVVFNWEVERGRFAPTLAGRAFVPAAKETDAELGLTVANYAQLRLNADWFTAQSWDAVILDEGQNIKTPTAATTRTACSLRAPHRAILTGTPVENRALDLWSLFHFAQPGLLGSQASFKRIYESPHTPEPLVRLRARVRHFMLRRTKGQVAPELPARIEEDIHVELDGAQAALYRAELKRARQLALGIESKTDFDQARFNVLQSLLRLRQICCDPRLGASGNAKGKPGAKIAQLLEQIEPILSEGHKVLVFSQFVEMLGYLGEALTGRGIEFLKLTGQTDDRQALVERFQSPDSPSVFLLSLKAAGAGLNLTAASYVVLFDPWWNPAVEAQAIDRTHRIGQDKTVIAYRLIARDTIEEKIRALQMAKADVANAIVLEESLAKVLDVESLRFLLAE